ncbi:MAG TPA: Asp-tRNA(Asn)/Glu-tRNA(Gln) amidotransferase subunit GatB [Clostridia bacterium]|nr:Asp-tRNA(Asn)/Glu-tRNA(Gln) amidotransferase subunit GatB [Clostridia bacterium]
MASTINNYEMVIGLEVHVELKTATKIFCSCPTTFGAEPNTQCCPVCMGMPGTLPVLNEQVVNYAVIAGLATNCQIAHFSKEDRKNYFYPDLPKAYQISQYDLPLCQNGYIDIEAGNDTKKHIGITRIHIEEDAGKLVHSDGKGTFIDCNRCGVPLIEIVSEPDIRSAEEAGAYLRKLRAIILYTGISDCKMNEGSMRCDVNLSVRKKGEKAFGTRTEMKNLNSFQFITKAIEYEFQRQVEAVESGEAIVQETRRFDQNTGKTYSMRRKEDANDYRYFPDPDLAPIRISAEMLQGLKARIPVLPDQRKREYVERFGLTSYASEQITSQKEIADYFEAVVRKTDYPALAASLIQTEVMRLLPQDAVDIPISTDNFARLAQLAGEDRINSSTCKKVLNMLWEKDQDPVELVQKEGLGQINDKEALREYAVQVVTEQPKLVSDFKKGKTAVLQAMVGQVMKKTSGKGNPVIIQELLTELIQ